MNSSDDPDLLAAIAESLHDPGAAAPTPPDQAATPEAPAETGAMAGPPCEVCVRLPNNQRRLHRFGLHATVGDVLAWLEGQGWDMRAHRLCTAFPRVPLLERSAALQDCGLQGPREVLLLERSQ